MIFSVQRFIEDYLMKQGLDCSDDYPARLANLYITRGTTVDTALLRRMRQLRTLTYRSKAGSDRKAIEAALLKALTRRFGKKNSEILLPEFVRAARLQQRAFATRTTPRSLLERFAGTVAARSIDSFWVSRTRGVLKPQPESIAQGLLGVFTTEALRGKGVVFREHLCGTGYVDMSIVLRGGVPHLVELKIHSKGKLAGPGQLGSYMKSENRREGWLVVFDARPPLGRQAMSAEFQIPEGRIRVIVVDINPSKPSRN